MSIGVAAVVILTALGDGARRYVVNEFSSLGSNLVIVLPGRSDTGGLGLGGLFTNTPRDLTIRDAQALLRAPSVQRVAPMSVGNSEIAYGGRLREVVVVGTTAAYLDIRRMGTSVGRFLPAGDPEQATAVAVLGATLQNELFGTEPAVGRMIRVGDRRLRVVGVLQKSGQGLGMKNDELVIVPVATAQAMFNTNTLFRVLVEARAARDAIASAQRQVEDLMRQRHDGELDITVITQDASARHLRPHPRRTDVRGRRHRRDQPRRRRHPRDERDARRGHAAHRRNRLLKALGATRAQTSRLAFLMEAALLSLAGALVGFALGHLGAWGPAARVPGAAGVAAGLGGLRRHRHRARDRHPVRRDAGPRPPRASIRSRRSRNDEIRGLLQLALRSLVAHGCAAS